MDLAVVVQGSLSVIDTGELQLAAGATLSRTDLTFADGGTIDGAGTLATSGSMTVAADGYGVFLGNSVTWSNAGTIAVDGAIGTFGAAAPTIVNASGGLFELAANGAGIVTGDIGSAFSNAGRLLEDGGGYSLVDSVLTNNGVVEAASGTAAFSQAIAGTGTLQIDARGTLEAASVGAGQTVKFQGSGGTLLLDAAQSLVLPTVGLGVGDMIDLADVSSAIAQINHNTLTVTPAGQPALTFVSATSLSGLAAQVANDGLGGLLVTFVAAPTKVTSLAGASVWPAGPERVMAVGASAPTVSTFRIDAWHH